MIDSWNAFFTVEEAEILRRRLSTAFLGKAQKIISPKDLVTLRLGMEYETGMSRRRRENIIPDLDIFELGYCVIGVTGDNKNFATGLNNNPSIETAYLVRAAMLTRLGHQSEVFAKHVQAKAFTYATRELLLLYRSSSPDNLTNSLSVANSAIKVADILKSSLGDDDPLSSAYKYFLHHSGINIGDQTIPQHVIEAIERTNIEE